MTDAFYPEAESLLRRIKIALLQRDDGDLGNLTNVIRPRPHHLSKEITQEPDHRDRQEYKKP